MYKMIIEMVGQLFPDMTAYTESGILHIDTGSKYIHYSDIEPLRS